MTKFTGPILGVDKYNANTKGWYSNLPMQASPDYFVWMDDFVGVDADYSANAVWGVVKDSGAGVANTADQTNGIVTLTSAATTDNDGALIQTAQTFAKLVSGKKAWFKAAIKLSDADQQDVFVGLATAAATNPEAVLAVDDYIGFKVTDESAVIYAVSDKTGASAAASTSTGKSAADATEVKVGFYFDGTSAHFYVNGDYVCSQSSTTIPTVALDVAIFSLSGSATGTRTLIVDYVYYCAER